MTKLTTAEAAALIFSTRGSNPPCPFSVTFYKKGKKNGDEKNEVREMVCFLGSNISKGLAGGPAAYNPADYSLVWVYISNLDQNFDEDPRHRRSIAIDGIIKVKVRGVDHEVDGKPWA